MKYLLERAGQEIVIHFYNFTLKSQKYNVEGSEWLRGSPSPHFM
jgi:hypothetical protein